LILSHPFAAIAALPAQSCVIDGEANAWDENGKRRDQVVTLCAFDLIEPERAELLGVAEPESV
jgi:hypothetical protein